MGEWHEVKPETESKPPKSPVIGKSDNDNVDCFTVTLRDDDQYVKAVFGYNILTAVTRKF